MRKARRLIGALLLPALAWGTSGCMPLWFSDPVHELGRVDEVPIGDPGHKYPAIRAYVNEDGSRLAVTYEITLKPLRGGKAERKTAPRRAGRRRRNY